MDARSHSHDEPAAQSEVVCVIECQKLLEGGRAGECVRDIKRTNQSVFIKVGM